MRPDSLGTSHTFSPFLPFSFSLSCLSFRIPFIPDVSETTRLRPSSMANMKNDWKIVGSRRGDFSRYDREYFYKISCDHLLLIIQHAAEKYSVHVPLSPFLPLSYSLPPPRISIKTARQTHSIVAFARARAYIYIYISVCVMCI